MAGSGDDLERILERIDGRGYRAYKDIRGAWDLGDCTLFVDHVQGDPFAAPSKVRVRVPTDAAGLPAALFASRARRIALEDFIARRVRRAIGGRQGGAGSGKSGLIAVDAGGQEVLERSAVRVGEAWCEVRLETGLPAAGRRALGREAIQLLVERVPDAALAGLLWEQLPQEEARRFVEIVENQEDLRARLAGLGLVAFVANGAVLPRESGASDRPLHGREVVSFRSPPALERTLPLPNPVDGAGGPREVTGMAVPTGVTLIVGGGYHGKSTLLRALERGVYAHVPGDGREGVVSDPALVKIRAEDGRRVERVDISPFIDALPGGRDTRAFSSDDASGSTSQAANIVEAIEAGARGLLLDEDTSATNFMVRDARMQALVHKEHEPITPFLDRVRELHERHGVSTVLVMGGSGDYFDVADRVLRMQDFEAFECSEEAHKVARALPSARRSESPAPLGEIVRRVPVARSFDASRGRREVKIDVKELDRILYGRDPIDLRGVEQLVDWSQTRAVGLAIHQATRRFMGGGASLASVLDAIETLLDDEGLDALDPFRSPREPGAHPGNLARPRRFEIAAAINRLRTVRMEAGLPSDEAGA